MKLTVFGNNATCPEADGACSCYLVEAAGKRILIDMGNGSVAKLQKQLRLTQLDGIIISHLHFDHFGDLFCAKYYLETKKTYGEDLKPIPLLIPALPQWAKAELGSNDVFEIHTISDGAAFDLDGVRVEFVAMVHLIESYGLRISAEGITVAYSGDTGICDGLQQIAEGADAFICESTFCAGETAEESHHLSAETAARTAAHAGVKQLFLTHYHSAQSQALLEEAKSVFPGAVLTQIGETYTIDTHEAQEKIHNAD